MDVGGDGDGGDSDDDDEEEEGSRSKAKGGVDKRGKAAQPKKPVDQKRGKAY
jgi:hypothetical protein